MYKTYLQPFNKNIAIVIAIVIGKRICQSFGGMGVIFVKYNFRDKNGKINIKKFY